MIRTLEKHIAFQEVETELASSLSLGCDAEERRSDLRFIKAINCRCGCFELENSSIESAVFWTLKFGRKIGRKWGFLRKSER